MKKIITAIFVLLGFAAGLNAASAPRPLTPGGASVYGYLLLQKDGVNSIGLCEFTPDGYNYLWTDPLFSDRYDWIMLNDGWYDDGKICGFSLDSWSGDYWYFEEDFETGKILKQTYLNTGAGWFILAALNPEEGYIYGFSTDSNDKLYWSRAAASNPGQIQTIAQITAPQRCYSLCFNPVEGSFYGINTLQQFVNIDASDGSQTVVSTVPGASAFDSAQTGLVYSPKDKVYYWNANMNDYSSRMYTISPDGEFNLWMNLRNGEEFLYLMTTDDANANPDQPERPVMEQASFNGGSLSGTVSFKMPDTYVDNRKLTGSLGWTLLVNDEAYASGTDAAGATVDVPVTVKENGTYTFTAYASLGGLDSYIGKLRSYVGFDTPLAPRVVDLTNTGVSWQAVTAGVNKGFVDTDGMSYEVYLNGKLLGTTQDTSFAHNLPVTGELERYTAAVYAVSKGMKSEAGESNTVVAGGAVALPVAMFPTEEEASLLSVYDANHDGVTWYVTTPQNGYGGMVIDGSDGDEDDYIFLPRARFDSEDAFYSFSFEAMARSTLYRESVKAVLATAPDAAGVIETIVPEKTLIKDDLTTHNYTTLSGEFKVPQAGDYYVGIQCTSTTKYNNGIVVRNFMLTNNNIVAASPGEVKNLSLVPGEKGALQITASFSFPTSTFNGEELPADAMLTATVSNGDFSSTVEGLPGQSVSLVVKALQGVNTVGVTVTDENGYNSVTVFGDVYCGVGIPANPRNVTLTPSADMMSAVLTWDPVTVSNVEGAYLDPEGVYYTVFEFIRTDYGNYWDVYIQGLKSTSLDIVLDEGAKMNEYAFAVWAVNEAGSTEDYTYGSAYMGTPYDLPFYDDFEELDYDYTLSTSPWLIYAGDWDFWYLYEVSDSFGMDETIVMAARADGSGKDAIVGMPRFTTSGMVDATLILDVLQGEGTGTLTVTASVYGSDEEIPVGETSMAEGSQKLATVSMPLPEILMAQPWVQLYLKAALPSETDVVAVSAIEIDATSHVGALKGADALVTGGRGEIAFFGVEGEYVSVHALDGRCVFAGKAQSGCFAVGAPSGIYVVRVGTRSVKVVVK